LIGDTRHPKVKHRELFSPLSGWRDHQVEGLEVAMHDPKAVCLIERVEQVPKELNSKLRREGSVVNQAMSEGLPTQQLHHHKG
jgi:hypothetical protein